MELTTIVLGVTLLAFGRKLYWLFVGIVGFLAGMELAALLAAEQPQWLLLVVALCAGVLGAVVAMLAQRVAFALAGFLAGAYIAFTLAQSLVTDGYSLLFFVVGGAAGAVLAVLVMDPALILLSCLVGAGAIVSTLGLGPAASALVYTALVIAGAVVQARSRPRGKERL